VETIHLRNATEWQVGDYVIQDAGAQRADKPMTVLGRNGSGIYRTRYAYPAEQPKSWRHKVRRNTVESLHDPRRFGVATPAINPGARASTEPRQPSSKPAHDPTATS
jgi:hypothetical protein